MCYSGNRRVFRNRRVGCVAVNFGLIEKIQFREVHKNWTNLYEN
jgi:hypothetical protein